MVDFDAEGADAARLMNRYLWGAAVDQLLADEQYLSWWSPDAFHGSAFLGAGSVYWPLTDHLGTVRDLVDSNSGVREHQVFDSFGNLVHEADFDAAGNPIASSHQDAVDTVFGYTGRAWDADVDLQYNRARWYSPTLGRWLSQDPIGFNAGDANLYRYVANRPTNAIDPSGLVEEFPAQKRPISPTDLRELMNILPKLPGEKLGDYLNSLGFELSINVPSTVIGPVGQVSGTGVCTGLGYQKGSVLFNLWVRSIHGFLVIDDKGYGAFEKDLNSIGEMRIRSDDLETYPTLPPSPSKVVPPFYSVLGEIVVDPTEHDVDKFRAAIEAYIQAEIAASGSKTYVVGVYDCFWWTSAGLEQALKASRIKPGEETRTEKVILGDPWPVDPPLDILD
ncbi:MAG: hypothetical protein KatS3mg111_0117 [Pirellulaceae bacterium]|nr:MAG: hypothetical protein KatS3mg111_0117 [Pirellulaceae bacterium]